MWPFKKSPTTGLYVKPRYRIMRSRVVPGEYFIWDRNKRQRVDTPYFGSLAAAAAYADSSGLEVDSIEDDAGNIGWTIP